MFETTITLKPGVRVAAGDDLRAAGRGDGLRGPAAGRHQRLDHADQGPDRHAGDRHPDAGRHQDLRARPGRAGAARQGGRAGGADGARHPQRLRRARGVGLLPGHRHRPRGGRAPRPQRGRRADRDRHRDRRDDHHPDGGGTGALRRADPLSAGAARQRRSGWPRCSIPVATRAAAARPAPDGAMGSGRGAAARRASGLRARSGQVATIRQVAGPMVVRTEDAMPTAWVYVDVAGRDIGSYVAEARARGRRDGDAPPGLHASRGADSTSTCSGRRRSSRLVVPATLAIIFLLLYFNFRSVGETLIVMLSLPFALVGGHLVHLAAGLQLVGRGRDRIHRAGRRGGRDRRRDADLPRSRLAGAAGGRAEPPRFRISTRRSWRARSSGCGPR